MKALRPKRFITSIMTAAMLTTLILALTGCGESLETQSSGSDGSQETKTLAGNGQKALSKLPAPENLAVKVQTERDGFDYLMFTYDVPESVKNAKNVDFRIEMRENSGEWITADTESPDPYLDPIIVQYTNGSLTSAFYRHGKRGKLALEQNTYKFRACFAIGNMTEGAYSSTITIGMSADDSSSGSESAETVIGLWHASPVLGSGWNRRLLLEKGGTFYWSESQMDAVSRVRFKTGSWENSGGKLVLNVTDTLKWEGGKVVDSKIFINGELTGYRVTWEINHRTPRTETYSVSAFGQDSSSGRLKMNIDENEFWMYSDTSDIQAIKDDYNTMWEQAE